MSGEKQNGRASVHIFRPGDRVLYSVTIAAMRHRDTTTHHSGKGIVLRPCGGGGSRPAYEIRTPQGKIKMMFANELRLAPPKMLSRSEAREIQDVREGRP